MLSGVAQFLSSFLDPPSQSSVYAALEILHAISATDKSGHITGKCL
jgi:HrpA-like RNA helicase